MFAFVRGKFEQLKIFRTNKLYIIINLKVYRIIKHVTRLHPRSVEKCATNSKMSYFMAEINILGPQLTMEIKLQSENSSIDL